jgi:hypothetical protein
MFLPLDERWSLSAGLKKEKAKERLVVNPATVRTFVSLSICVLKNFY